MCICWHCLSLQWTFEQNPSFISWFNQDCFHWTLSHFAFPSQSSVKPFLQYFICKFKICINVHNRCIRLSDAFVIFLTKLVWKHTLTSRVIHSHLLSPTTHWAINKTRLMFCMHAVKTIFSATVLKKIPLVLHIFFKLFFRTLLARKKFTFFSRLSHSSVSVTEEMVTQSQATIVGNSGQQNLRWVSLQYNTASINPV